ncbi:hypothetical protein [Alkalibacterium sp. AK22]|uniref:hypothetical protein n=1 Tax=Alkalibacterium sp. AK22 TaxID=1229520 RepID=UPI0012DF4955|nr:hypothetical protein [Alkalibacterium sp. AK22]
MLTLLLRNVLDTRLGHWMYALSFFGLIAGLLSFSGIYVYYTIKQQVYNFRYRKKHQESE